MRLFYFAAAGLFLMTCAGAGAAPRTVIDHDPMGVSIGSPPPMVGAEPSEPGKPPPPPIETVTPNPALNQIVIEAPTPISVSTGNLAKTSERMCLACYYSQGHFGGTVRLQHLREGAHADYSLLQPSAGISDGRAKFVIVFHRDVLRAGHRYLSARTVYIVAAKAMGGRQEDGSEFIQTATVLNNDPAAFPHQGDKE